MENAVQMFLYFGFYTLQNLRHVQSYDHHFAKCAWNPADPIPWNSSGVKNPTTEPLTYVSVCSGCLLAESIKRV